MYRLRGVIEKASTTRTFAYSSLTNTFKIRAHGVWRIKSKQRIEYYEKTGITELKIPQIL